MDYFGASLQQIAPAQRPNEFALQMEKRARTASNEYRVHRNEKPSYLCKNYTTPPIST